MCGRIKVVAHEIKSSSMTTINASIPTYLYNKILGNTMYRMCSSKISLSFETKKVKKSIGLYSCSRRSDGNKIIKQTKNQSSSLNDNLKEEEDKRFEAEKLALEEEKKRLEAELKVKEAEEKRADAEEGTGAS